MEDTEKILGLTCRSKSGLMLRIEHALLDKDMAATIAQRFFNIIKHQTGWCWPDSESHMRNCRSAIGRISRVGDPEENDDDYRERLHSMEVWPQRYTQEEAEWIEYAIIIAKTLRFLTDQSGNGVSLKGLHEGRPYYFDPNRFYRYMWMCLMEGLGVETWVVQPQQPPAHLGDRARADWYTREAERIVKRVRADWNKGQSLASLTGEISAEWLQTKASQG